MLIWRPRSRSISRVVVISFTTAVEMLRLRGRQISMTFFIVALPLNQAPGGAFIGHTGGAAG